MSMVTLEVDIDNGRIIPRSPEKLPLQGSGLLTIDVPELAETQPELPRKRVELPIIRCAPGTSINPTPEELDASLWGD